MVDEHAHCPHCRALLQEDAPHPFPERPVRCAACHLLVGPGRSRDADGRPRRMRPVVDGAVPTARPDGVRIVLDDLRSRSIEAEIGDRAVALER